jgi:hypothetical protein
LEDEGCVKEVSMTKCSELALAFWGASLLLGPVALQPGDDKGDDTKRLAGTWIIDPVTYKDAKDKDLRSRGPWRAAGLVPAALLAAPEYTWSCFRHEEAGASASRV